MNLMCFVGTKSTFKVPIPEIHTQIITNPIATKNPLVETNRKPTKNHGKLFQNFTFFFPEVKNGRLAFNREIQLDTLEAPSKIAPVFWGWGWKPERRSQKGNLKWEKLHHTFFEFQMIIVYDLSKHIRQWKRWNWTIVLKNPEKYIIIHTFTYLRLFENMMVDFWPCFWNSFLARDHLTLCELTVQTTYTPVS